MTPITNNLFTFSEGPSFAENNGHKRYLRAPRTPSGMPPPTPSQTSSHGTRKRQRSDIIVISSENDSSLNVTSPLPAQSNKKRRGQSSAQVPSDSSNSMGISQFEANEERIEHILQELMTDDDFFDSIPCSPDIMGNKQSLRWVFQNGEPKCLGSGGFGSVYLARLNDDKLVAVKLFTKEFNPIKSIFHEASLQTWLSNHQVAAHFHGLVSLSESEDYQNIGLVMEFLGSTNTYKTTRLCDLLTVEGLDWKAMSKQLAEQLAKIHKLDVILNDIKGDNIIFHWVGGQLKPYFIDLGLANYAPCSYTYAVPRNPNGSDIFCHPYTAPERDLYGLSTPKSDIYSMGEMLMRIEDFTGTRLDHFVSLCKQHNYKHRPTASGLAQMLSTYK